MSRDKRAFKVLKMSEEKRVFELLNTQAEDACRDWIIQSYSSRDHLKSRLEKQGVSE